MADTKISALTGAATPLAGTEVLPIVQSGATVKVAVSDLTAGRAVNVLSLTSTNDATINSTTVGLGAGLVATNTAVGASVLAANISGSNVTAIGYQAALINTTGSNLTACGVSALSANTIGGNNSAFGYRALFNLTSAAATLGAVTGGTGYNGGGSAGPLTVQASLASGSAAGTYPTLAITVVSGVITAATLVTFGNKFINATTVLTVTSAAMVTAGFTAGGSGFSVPVATLATGQTNTAMGYQAANSLTTGGANVLIGNQAGFSMTTPNYNTACGNSALTSTTSGGFNNAFGSGALGSGTTATNNTAMGYNAGFGITTGSSNTYLGYQATQSNVAATGEIVISTGTTIGKGNNTGYVNASGGVYQGNNLTVWSVTSDQRIKKNIVDNNIGLEIIKQIQIRNFEYRLPEEVDASLMETDTVSKEGMQLGVIAQEFQQVLPDCVKEESTGVLTINTSDLTWYLINAVKELSARLAALETK